MSEMLRGTEDHQRRVMMCTGAAIAATAVLTYGVVSLWPVPEPDDTTKFVLTTPIVGEGIAVDAKVLLRGVAVGTVTALDHHGGLTEVGIRLSRSDTRGLTDSFKYDFRPANTFGVSALSLDPQEGGNAIADGQHIDRAPEINATMAQVLTGTVNFANKVLTDKLAALIGRSVDYTNALAPLLETGFALTSLIAQTQQEVPATLLARANQILEPLPVLADTVFTSVHGLRSRTSVNDPIENPGPLLGTIEGVGSSLLGKVGDVFGKYQRELGPTVEIAKSFADAVTSMIQRSRGSVRLDKLLAGLTEVYNGPRTTHTTQNSFNLRLVLEPLPALESALPPLSNLDGTPGGAG
ncbi:virulence factor Mce family protein [Mycobacteroides abscessus subsp. abscessus]|nr:virulence factor Mce family protein [Mycobacteroides abscessus subsp. abscessus]